VGDAEDKSARHAADDHLLDRWSRRKMASRMDEAVAETPQAAVAAAREPLQDKATTVEPDPRLELTDADMPPIESLDGNSDFSVFMSPKVSEQLRTLALRKLFHLPAFNVTDGLNDYDEDYTRFAGLGEVVTQEMKRMLKRELEAAEVIADQHESPPVVQAEAPADQADVNKQPVDETDEDSDKV